MKWNKLLTDNIDLNKLPWNGEPVLLAFIGTTLCNKDMTVATYNAVKSLNYDWLRWSLTMCGAYADNAELDAKPTHWAEIGLPKE